MQSRATGIADHILPLGDLFLFSLPLSSFFLPFGQRPRRGRSPVEHRGTFVRPSVLPFVPPLSPSDLKFALSGLKFTLSGLKSALSGLKFTLSGLKSALSGLESVRADFRPERAHFRPESADSRS